jgi:hypothetical protein
MPTIPEPADCLSGHKLTKALKTFLKRLLKARLDLFTVAARDVAFDAEKTCFSWLKGTSAAEKILQTISYRSAPAAGARPAALPCRLTPVRKEAILLPFPPIASSAGGT